MLTVNARVAANLREAARLLELQDADGFRIRAYRRAAQTVESLDEDLGVLVERGGVDALMELPGIGRGIAAAIGEMLAHGRWSRLDRLRGELEPVRLFQRIPGIGPRLAARIIDDLHIDTLEALEVAAHDGRLANVPGIGARRVAAIRSVLASMLGSSRPVRHITMHRPDVALVLDVDREYRRAASEGRLPTIAPKRFNPRGRRWLPIMHVLRDGWHFTALFSNTARAHQAGRTHDWVVVYYYDDQHWEGQCTIVTERRGSLSGRRVVRGRERECLAHYSLPGGRTDR